MNFSELFKQTNQLCRFSPNGKYMANCVQYRLLIRDVKTLQILQLYTCLDVVQYIEWTSDSLYVLCTMLKRGLIQVWSLEKPDWTCKIDEGLAGLLAARWSPDGRHILSTADFQLRISVWSLVSKSVSYIKYPKHASAGLDFSADGKYMALAERRNCKDCISIFACTTWQLLKHFEVETKDLADLAWSPDGRVLCVWDSLLRLRIVERQDHTSSTCAVAAFLAAILYELFLYSVDGRCLSRYSAYEFALGIKCVCWSPSSQFLAIGSFDEKVVLSSASSSCLLKLHTEVASLCRVLNHVTWKIVAEHCHTHTVDSPSVIVYKEVEMKPPLLRGELMSPGGFTVQSKYEVQPVPVQVPSVRPDPEKPNPKLGVSQVSFSRDNRYMATKNDNMPNALWLWDVSKLCLAALLLQSGPIRAFSWDPKQARLAICTGNNKLYMWSPAGCVSVVVPTETPFQVTSLNFHPDGNILMLLGKEQFCLCFLSDPRT